MPVAPDISVFSKNQGYSDYQRANEEFAQRKALQQAQIQLAGAQAQKALVPDYAEMGQAAFIKAATQGVESLTPTERALLIQADAKQQTWTLNPVTGAMEQKPSMMDRAGINLNGVPPAKQPAMQPLAQPRTSAPMSPENASAIIDVFTADANSPAMNAASSASPMTPKSRQLQQELEVKGNADRSQNFTKAQSSLLAFGQQAKLVSDTLDKAITLAETSNTATNYGQIFSKLPNTDSRALNNYLDTIKSNLGFEALQVMRENSPTGGALGQVSDMENRLLQATKGALDPLQGDQLVANLKIIKELYPVVLAEKQRAFTQDFGNVTPLGNNPQPAQPVVLSTDAPAPSDKAAATTQFVAQKYKTPDDVKAAYKAGKITKDQATSILQSVHGFEQ